MEFLREILRFENIDWFNKSIDFVRIQLLLNCFLEFQRKLLFVFLQNIRKFKISNKPFRDL